jgi:hypothetical protein
MGKRIKHYWKDLKMLRGNPVAVCGYTFTRERRDKVDMVNRTESVTCPRCRDLINTPAVIKEKGNG